ncbi:MAG: YihY family inner membrane protein [Desulfobacterota bacterium]|nr:YihY family inner membrane protein [Thermodesulfobacteriota bacterium]
MNQSVNNAISIIGLALRRFYQEKRLLWAASLTFTTMFALVPLLSVLFFVFNVFGDLSQLKALIQPYVYKLIAPGAQQDVLNIINDLVEHVDFKTIGIFSSSAVVVSVFLLLFEIECSLNEIWLIRKRISMLSRAALYWVLLTVGPLLVAVSLFIIVSLQSYQLVRSIEFFVEPQIIAYASYGLMWIAFTALYYFMPGTRVRFWSALFGGIVAGTIWKIAGFLFSLYTSRFLFYYPKIYGSLAAVPIFMLWIFFCWIVFLLGAEITYLHQHRRFYQNALSGTWLNPSTRRYITLLIMLWIARRFREAQPLLTIASIADATGIPPHLIQDIVEPLLKTSLLVAAPGYNAPLAPGKPITHITVGDILDHAAGHDTIQYTAPGAADDALCRTVIAAVNSDAYQQVRHLSLKQLLDNGSVGVGKV